MKKNDGGPAFPVFDGQSGPYGGMTLRDYFAAAALTGLRSNNPESAALHSSDNIAHLAYADADAMLAELEKGAGDG
jgi:hypothetical protein